MYPLRSIQLGHPTWVNLTELRGADFTLVRWEDNLAYWRVLHEVVDSEPPFQESRRSTGSWPRWASPKASPSTPTSAWSTS